MTTYAEKIRDSRPKLSKSFKRLADYILDSYIQTALMTASELAHEVDVDAATVVRFAQRLDYSGFPQLQDEIKQRVLDELHIGPRDVQAPDSASSQADVTLGQLAEAIERSRQLLDSKAFEALVSAIAGAQRVLILADPEVLGAAQRFRFQLEASGGVASVFPPYEGTLAQALASAQEKDLVLAIDISGQSQLVSSALAQAKSFGLKTAAIVGAASFDSARQAEAVLEIQYQERAQVGDVIMTAIFEAMGAALRWKKKSEYEEHLAKVHKARRRLARQK